MRNHFPMVSYMKSGLATSLSLAGVLLAGGSALALNSSVLQNSSTVRGTPALAATVSATGADTANGGITALGNTDAAVAAQNPSVQAKGVADVIVDPTTSVADTPSTSVVPTTSVVAPTPQPSVPSSTVASPPATVEKAFQVEDIAVITLNLNGRTLTVKSVAVTPGSPYKVTNTYSHDGDDVRITLASPTRTIEFSARVINGQVVAAISNPTSGNLPPRPPHDDDDEEDDDDHDERPAPPRRTEDRNNNERENDDD